MYYSTNTLQIYVEKSNPPNNLHKILKKLLFGGVVYAKKMGLQTQSVHSPNDSVSYNYSVTRRNTISDVAQFLIAASSYHTAGRYVP